MAITFRDLMCRMEQLAPPRYAEPWDNVGLQVGSPHAEIETVLLAVDATRQVVDECARKNAGALVVHHPLLFGEVRSVRSDRWPGCLLTALIEARCGLYVAHTNLDSAPQTNTSAALARSLGLSDLRMLTTHAPDDLAAVLVRVEAGSGERWLSEASQAGAEIRSVSGADGGRPACDRTLELVVPRERLADILNLTAEGTAGRVWVLDVRPVLGHPPFPGLGVVGQCAPMTVCDLTARVRSALALKSLRVSSGADGEVTMLAAAAGSAKGLLDEIAASGAQAFVAGEVGHHLAVEAAENGIAAIEVGHFASERPGIVHLAELLQETFRGAATIEVSNDHTGPFADR